MLDSEAGIVDVTSGHDLENSDFQVQMEHSIAEFHSVFYSLSYIIHIM